MIPHFPKPLGFFTQTIESKLAQIKIEQTLFSHLNLVESVSLSPIIIPVGLKNKDVESNQNTSVLTPNK